ncbi:MAG: hypothetical protein A2666_01945 [Parcubacteria group bacterium RIFCSPHIGHO2_01_FULL_47_10b]|nr:MAG: hypothetical protein A2666_01945 [Parcubacteria group bacterium RIFCSPHIGHO2_01_FULL_47_10b]
MGPPGSGKGTQAALLAERFDVQHIESSKIILKNFAERPTDSDVIEAKAAYDSGELVPPPILFAWLQKEVRQLLPLGKHMVFDGSPRSVYEQERLYPLLCDVFGKQNIKGYYLELSDEIATYRMQYRRLCSVCNRTVPYTEQNKDLTTCPYEQCGGVLIKKSLDTPEVIAERLRVFIRRTKPVADFLIQEGVMKVLNGDENIELIHKIIVSKLGF